MFRTVKLVESLSRLVQPMCHRTQSGNRPKCVSVYAYFTFVEYLSCIILPAETSQETERNDKM